jgi:DNA-binding GntR family transcriptional regulator
MQERPPDGSGLPGRQIDTSSVQERLIDELRRMIISGELRPRTRLSEYALAGSFGVSRTPVREALKQLQVEGLVEIVPRVGTFVAQPSRRQISELFTLKEVFEGFAARLVAQSRPKESLERLHANLDASREAVDARDTQRSAELMGQFHNLIVEAAGNSKLMAHYRTLMNQLAYQRLVLTAAGQPGRLERSLGEHARIIELLEAGDVDGAEFQMRSHVAAAHRELVAGLRRAESGDEPTL